MPPKKKMSSSITQEKKTKTSDEVDVVEKKSKSTPLSPKPLKRAPRPMSLKYLSAQEYLLRKGVKASHIPIYVAKAKSLGYTRATASEWDKLLFNET